MVEDDITIHPQNSLNSGYQGYTKPFYGSNIEYNPKFLGKIKKRHWNFSAYIVLFISTGPSNLDDRFSH